MMPLAIWLQVIACGEKDPPIPNAAPTITMTNPLDGDTWIEDSTVQLLAQVSDADHASADLQVRWLIDGSLVCDWSNADGGGNATCEVIAALGMRQVRAEVQDPDGSSMLREVSIEVEPTSAPVTQIITPMNGGQFYAEQLIDLSAQISDADTALEELTVVWTDSVSGTLEIAAPDEDGWITDQITLSEGSHTITLEATDPTGKSHTSSVDLIVRPANSAPTCEIVQPISGEFSLADESVTFAGTMNDVDIDSAQLAVTWTSNRDGELSSGMADASGTYSFSTNTLTRNTHQITLTVTDEMGLQCTDTIEYSIGSPPSIIVQQPYVGTIVNEGDEVIFSAYVSDTEQSGSQLVVEWSSDIDGTLYFGPAESNGISFFDTSTLSFGTHLITATVTDLDGLYRSANVELIVNAIPSQPSVFISPNPATTTDDLVANASGSIDDDGTIPTYQYVWYKDNTLMSSFTGSSISASNTLKNQTWKVVVTPTDGITTGPSVETQLTVSNTPPSMNSVSVSPTSPTTQDNILCAYSASDVDVQDTLITYSFNWFINGNAVSGATDTLNGPFLQGDVVTCRVTPNDGVQAGAFMESSTTVLNTAPIVHSVTLSPNSNATDDIITATVDSTDLDGDTLTHTWIWFVNGVAVQNSSNTNNSDTLDGVDYFDKNDVVYAQVTADDGTASDMDVSASQTIQNTAPVAFNAFIDPINPVAGVDDLLCSVQTSDIDGDTLSLTYSWTLNGSALNYSGNSIPTNQLVDGDTWVCSIFANDGTANSPTTSASTTIGANVEAAVGQNICAAASFSADANYDLASCLSDLTVVSGESTDSSGYTLQFGSHYVYTPE